MRRCAASFVIAAYLKVRLIPQDLRALHMELFTKSSTSETYYEAISFRRNNTMSEKMSLYTRMVRAGRRTYFFDVREARNNKKFLIISESTPSTDGTFNRSSVLVFQEDIDNFLAAFSEAKELIK